MEEIYKERFEKLPSYEKVKVVQILEYIGHGLDTESLYYGLSHDATQLIIDIIRAKVLRV